MIILDTDCLSLLERKSGVEFYRLTERLAKLQPNEVTTTIITFEEQMRGWLAYLAKADSVEKQIIAYEKLNRFLNNYRYIPVIKFDEKAGEAFKDLKKQKIKVGTMDLKIASIAVSQNALLISRNLSDYEQIPNLRVEDWTKETYSN